MPSARPWIESIPGEISFPELFPAYGALELAIRELPCRERLVIIEVFYGRPKAVTRLSKKMKVSKARITQLKQQALRRLKDKGAAAKTIQ